jgi:ketosteroid isomerase-like protein
MTARELSVLWVTVSLFLLTAALRSAEAKPDEGRAALLLIFSLNMWAQQPEARSLSGPEPGLQVRQEFLRAYNAKDVDAVVALYADDATLVSDGGTFKGPDEIRKWVKSGLDQGSTLVIEPSMEKSSGTLAYGTGRTRRLVGSVIHLGQYLIVMEKIGGDWKIVQHFSLSAEKPQP